MRDVIPWIIIQVCPDLGRMNPRPDWTARIILVLLRKNSHLGQVPPSIRMKISLGVLQAWKDLRKDFPEIYGAVPGEVKVGFRKR